MILFCTLLFSSARSSSSGRPTKVAVAQRRRSMSSTNDLLATDPSKVVCIGLCGTRKKFTATYTQLRAYGEQLCHPSSRANNGEAPQCLFKFVDLVVDDGIVTVSDKEATVDVVLLKLSGAPPAAIDAFNAWLGEQSNRSTIVLVEPFDRVNATLFRSAFYTRLDEMERELAGVGFGVLPWTTLPGFWSAEDAAQRNIGCLLPQARRRGDAWIVKTDAACGASTTHLMGVLRDTAMIGEDGGDGDGAARVSDVQSTLLTASIPHGQPLVAQAFVRDGCCPFVFKVYLISGEVVMVTPTSTQGLHESIAEQLAASPVATFDSQAKSACAASSTRAGVGAGNEHVMPMWRDYFAPGTAARAELEAAAQLIFRHPRFGFHIDLLGFDVVLRPVSDDVASPPRAEKFVVDVNYFPGYRGVTDIEERLLQLLVRRLRSA